MKVILHYIKPFIPRMSLGIFIKFIGAVMELFLPWILSYLVDDIVPLRDMRLILFWGSTMILASVFSLVTNIVANRMAAWVAQHTTQALRHDLFKKISYLSCSQIDQYSIPSLESRLTSDTYNVHQMIGMMQRMGVRAPILLLGGILITLTLDPVLTLVLVCTLPFLAVLVYSVSKRGIPLYVSLQQGVDSMVRTVRENISGIRVIKALSKTDFEKERFAQVNGEVVRREKKAGITMALTNPMMNVPGKRRAFPSGKDHRFFKLFHHHPERHDGHHPHFRHVFQRRGFRFPYPRGAGYSGGFESHLHRTGTHPLSYRIRPRILFLQ